MVSNTKVVFSDPFTEVVERPLYADSVLSSRRAILAKDRDGEFREVGVVSNGYQLIHNSLALDIVSDIQSRTEFGWRTLKTVWPADKGYKFSQLDVSDRKIETFDHNGKANEMYLGMMTRNSYDGSTAFGFELFLFNMLCSNQYINRNRFGYFSIRHDDNRSFDIQDSVRSVHDGVGRAIETAPRFRSLQTRSVDLKALVGIRHDLDKTLPGCGWGETIKRLDGDTQWDVYQAMTNYLSHEKDGLSSLRQNDQITTYFLNAA